MSNTYAGRDRKKDSHVIASAIVEGLYINNDEYGAWCIDCKRPFGNSDVEGDMIEMLGIDCKDEDAREYVSQLYKDAGDYIAERWSELADPTEVK